MTGSPVGAFANLRPRTGIRLPRVRVPVGSAVLGLVLLVAPTSPGQALPARAQQERPAQVRFVHGVPDVPSLDIYVDGELRSEGVPYATATNMVELPAGAHEVVVAPAGGDPADAVAEADTSLEPGASYAVAAVGLSADDAVEVRTYRANLAPVAEGESRVRLIHASPDAPAVDVAVEAGDVIFASATFNFAPDPAEIPAGTYDLEMRLAGTTDIAQRIPDVSIEAKRAYTIMAVGILQDDDSLEIVTFFSPLADLQLPAAGTGPAAIADDVGRSWTWLLAAVGAAAFAFVATGTWRKPKER